MKKKNGFTLIELLAVIIILGILMIIAIPSVTKYISDSRKSSYVDSAKEIIGSARNLVNSGELEMYDTDATYYIDVNCIKTENAMKSPYGDFVKEGAYVVVTYDGKGYDYFWTSVDDAGQGVKNIVKYDKLDTDDISSDLTIEDISTLRTLDGRGKVILITERNSCKKEGAITENLIPVNSETGEEGGSSGGSGGTTSNIVCKPATTLHTATCNRTDSYGCNATGQAGNGNTITYGTLVSGSPKAGDAYDCKVSKNGDYTERFYYVSPFYDTITSTFDDSKAVLIYYTNVNDLEKYSSGGNWIGPDISYELLPSDTVWDHPGLIAPGERQMKNEEGTLINDINHNYGGPYNSVKFTYTGKSSRFLTVQELGRACNKSTYESAIESTGALDNCIWLLENLSGFESDSNDVPGYWLETSALGNGYCSWRTLGSSRMLNDTPTSMNDIAGVRPVITVLTSNISN